MRLITGDECGLLKECIPELSRKLDDKEAPIAPHGAMPKVTTDGVSRIDSKETQTRARGNVDMTFVSSPDDTESLSFAALRQNGSVELWEGTTEGQKRFGNYKMQYATKNLFSDIELDKDTRTRPLGIGYFPSKGLLCAGDILGNLSIIKSSNGKEIDTFNAYLTSKQGKTISYTPGKTLNTQLATAMAFDPIHDRVAVGGRERETTMLDLYTGKVVFKAKNLPPDPQTLLQQPIWPSAIQFFEGSNVMAVGTAYKQIRLYDVRENTKTRRPTACTPEGLLEFRVTSLCQIDDHELVIGDAAGSILSLDIRTLGKNPKSPVKNNMGRYVGPAGSIRQLKKHPTLPRLAAVGLDRMLRIYDTNTRKQLDCIYLKQRLNCVLFGSDDTWELENDYVDDENDDWDIDQDDVVQDYVDSDEENGSQDDDDDSSRNENSGEISEDGSDVDSDHDSEEDSGDDESADSNHSDNSTNNGSSSDGEGNEMEDEDGSNSEADEEVIITAPKKRRRR